MKRIVVLTGAGISAESGIQTFRDADGLWEGHDVMAVATPEGWHRNRALVLKFYNDRRRQLLSVEPNAAHRALVELEKQYGVCIVTQNVDDLHERAGSQNVIHLHGELRKVRSSLDEDLVYSWDGDLNLGDKCEKGSQLRPHVVWFGEAVPMIHEATMAVVQADIIIVIGSSMQVYPAASLTAHARRAVPIYYIDPKPSLNEELKGSKTLTVIAEKATVGVRQLVDKLLIPQNTEGGQN
jgi:NAD-dependent deacetylase